MYNPQESRNNLTIYDCRTGRYVACIYDHVWFTGNVIEVSDQNQDLQVKFMAKQIVIL